jgi:tRNA nucleotidyltransferase (CCA-adding enzyme)
LLPKGESDFPFGEGTTQVIASLKIELPTELKRILNETPELNSAFLVGGSVRDSLGGHPGTDLDVECFGVSYDDLAKALRKWGRTDLVGKSFGVIKLTTGSGEDYDFSIPRRDSKAGIGHQGFAVEFDPAITPREAAERRDYTINALMYDPRKDELLDFFGGREDLENRVLRHTSDAFADDPLRVLRGMQFAGRFGLTAHAGTIELCREIADTYSELAVERVREEWFKWAAKSTQPSAGIFFLEATGWLEHFPEIAILRGTPQDPVWHPEGDVLVHTCHCLDAMAKLPGWQNAEEETRIVLMFGILAHDFGKPETTAEEFKHGRMCIVSPGHDEVGVAITERFFERIGATNVMHKRVPPLVKCHMAHLQTVNARSVRRLARRLQPATIEELCVVIQADHNGRPPNPPHIPEGVTALLSQARELRIEANAPKPILLGRHLIERGLQPGKEFGTLLKRAFEAQLDGEFTDLDGALAWFAEQSR